ncbi:sigma-70 family RNA polymerase sigma factor [Microbacterium tumbae]
MPSWDTERLTALYDAHAKSVWRYVFYLVGDGAVADDIIQETLIRAWRTRRILEQDPEKVRAWLFTVARNLVIDDVRSARRRREITVADVPERMLTDRTDAILDALLIQESLADLTADHRAVIELTYFGGRSIVQAAAELDIAEGTVKSRLHYGLRALRLALQERGVTR